ncbi:MAG: hypothetical protein J6Y78_07255 [Paludibacteraceae bacterium]|nr:hypothetical protein [Paludibacteraceae bacterium]
METNNLSTYATWTAIIVMLLQVIFKYFNIEIGQNELTIIANGIIALIIALWSSYNPNTIPWLGNAPEPIDTEEPVLNPEYECDDSEC